MSQQPNQENEVEFPSPPMVSKSLTSTTPETIDTSTPTVNQNQTNTKKYNKEIINPTLYKKEEIIKQEIIQENAKTDTKTGKTTLDFYLMQQLTRETKSLPFRCITK